MNYRSRQIRSMWEKDISAKNQEWAAERHQLQQDIINLQNSTEAQVVAQLEAKVKEKQKLLDQTVELLGSSDIKSLTDLTNLLKGQTLKELITSQEQKLAKANQSRERRKTRLDLSSQKIKELETQLLNLAKQKITKQKQATELLNQLESQWQEKQTNWEQQAQEQQETYAQELASTKADHSEEVRTLKQKHSQDQARAIELEKTQAEQKLQAQQEQNQTYQTTVANLTSQNQAKQEQITTLQQANSTATETIQTHLNRINQLEEYLTQSRQESQTKQNTITQLNQDKVGLQQQITQLSNQLARQKETLDKVHDYVEELYQNRSEYSQITNLVINRVRQLLGRST